MNDKEIIKKLAEGIKDTYISHHSECCIHCNIYDDDGTFIRDNFGFYHNLNCPVLLAEEVLKEKKEDKPCYHSNAYFFHENAPMFCPDCGKYIDGGKEINNKENETPFSDALNELQSDIAKQGPSKERFCPSCGGQNTIEPVKGTEPYSEDYLICNKCDSTFNKEEDKPQFTKEQAKDIIQCIFGTHFQFVQNDGLSHIENLINAGYIIDSKTEQPEIVHNVMKYKGEYYLRQFGDCIDCAFHGVMCHIETVIIKFGYLTKCMDTGTIWKSFKDIPITDELACMRKDIGDIYLYNIQENKIDKLTYVEDGRKSYVHTIGWRSTNDNMRLATAEEIQKHLEGKK